MNAKLIKRLAAENIPGLTSEEERKDGNLETLNSDRLDFIQISVRSLKALIIAAFEAGQNE